MDESQLNCLKSPITDIKIHAKNWASLEAHYNLYHEDVGGYISRLKQTATDVLTETLEDYAEHSFDSYRLTWTRPWGIDQEGGHAFRIHLTGFDLESMALEGVETETETT